MMKLIQLLVLGLVITGCQSNAGSNGASTQVSQMSGDLDQTIVVDGDTRSYILHIPPGYTGQTALPLVIVLHGGGGNAQNAIRMTGMSATADENDFLVAYLNGSGLLGERILTWNAGNCCGYALRRKVDDVAFVRAAIANIQAEYAVDPARIYATGMSNGGMMTYRLGCELSDVLAGIAPVAGALNVENCQPTAPLPVIIFHGTEDRHVLYEGGQPEQQMDTVQRTDQSVAYAVAFWVKHNQCSTTPQRTEEGNIIQETYTNCSNNADVTLYTVVGGGHAWPGGERGSVFGDAPTREIKATDLIWAFFASHHRS